MEKPVGGHWHRILCEMEFPLDFVHLYQGGKIQKDVIDELTVIPQLIKTPDSQIKWLGFIS